MANPVSQLQELTNKSIIELFSVELVHGSHYRERIGGIRNATYSQSGQTITITLNSHGLSAGLVLSLDFTSGDADDGVYTIQSTATNTFTVTSPVSQSTSGNVSFRQSSNLDIPTVFLFHSGNNLKDFNNIVWQSNTYSKFPVKAEGYMYSGKGKLPRPTLTFSNLLGTITTIIERASSITPFIDLQGAKVIRRRTLSRFLDAVNFPSNVNPYGTPDPTAEMPREVFFIERKVVENRDIVQFELASSFDLLGISAPKKLVTREDFTLVGTFVYS